MDFGHPHVFLAQMYPAVLVDKFKACFDRGAGDACIIESSKKKKKTKRQERNVGRNTVSS